jgi:hypothetical protein
MFPHRVKVASHCKYFPVTRSEALIPLLTLREKLPHLVTYRPSMRESAERVQLKRLVGSVRSEIFARASEQSVSEGWKKRLLELKNRERALEPTLETVSPPPLSRKDRLDGIRKAQKAMRVE